MTRRAFYSSLLFLLPCFLFAARPTSYGDLAVWVFSGQEILRQKTLYFQDHASFLSTQSTYYPWLLSLFYALVVSISSLKALALLHQLVPLVWAWYWWRSWRKRGMDFWQPWPILFSLLAIVGTEIICSERPALLATLPFLFVADRLTQEKLVLRDYLWLTLAIVFWTNLHGSFPLFFVLCGWRLVFSRNRSGRDPSGWIFLFVPLSFLMSFLNPWGWRAYTYVWQTMVVSHERGLTEWFMTGDLRTSYAYAQYAFQAYRFYACALLVGIFCWRGKNWKIAHPFWPSLLMGMSAIRNSAFIFLLLPNMMTDLLPSLPLRAGAAMERKSVLNIALIVALFFAIIALDSPYRSRLYPLLPPAFRAESDEYTPEEIANTLQTLPPGNLFNEMEYGSYLLLAQNHPIFMDARNIIYSEADFKNYQAILAGSPTTLSLLASYQVRYVVVSCERHALRELLAAGAWQAKLRERGICLFLR